MQLHDFDRAFADFLADWVKEHATEYANVDEMEADMPDVYTRWLNKPADWLGGMAPGLYFSQFGSAEELVSMLRAYLAGGVALPDPLLEAIAAWGEGARGSLLELLDEGNDEERMLAVSLLQETDATPPIDRYIEIILDAEGLGELAVAAAEALRSAGAWKEALAAMEGAPTQVKLCLMDLLADYPCDESKAYARALFDAGEEQALMAAYMARMGDEKALPLLIEAAEEPSTDYLTYIEVVNAIDALGGEIPPAREFTGDPLFESLKGLL